jgi:zinc-binding RING finger protein
MIGAIPRPEPEWHPHGDKRRRVTPLPSGPSSHGPSEAPEHVCSSTVNHVLEAVKRMESLKDVASSMMVVLEKGDIDGELRDDIRRAHVKSMNSAFGVLLDRIGEAYRDFGLGYITCGVCNEPYHEELHIPVKITSCRHMLCQSCYGKLLSQFCPFCRTPIAGIEPLVI